MLHFILRHQSCYDNSTFLHSDLQAGTPYVDLSKNSTMPDIPLGYYAVYSLLLKVPPGDRTDLEITATVDKPGLDVCSIRVATAGADLPCVTENFATKTYAPQSATIDLDIVTNFGKTKG